MSISPSTRGGPAVTSILKTHTLCPSHSLPGAERTRPLFSVPRSGLGASPDSESPFPCVAILFTESLRSLGERNGLVHRACIGSVVVGVPN